MFNLDQAISEWRQRMLAAGIKTPVPLEELENHLRDDVEWQMKSGLTEQKAFEIAVERIGQASSLNREFKKVSSTDRTLQRKWASRICAAVLGIYSLAVAWILSTHDLTFNERMSGFASLGTVLVSVSLILQIIPRLFPVIANRSIHSAVGVIGAISGAGWFLAFAYLILPRYNFTPGQLLVTIFWAAVPMLVWPAVAVLGLDKSESQQFGTTRC
jgi:hypothetical protein